MTFDKNAQRLRAAEFEMEQLAKGVKKPVPAPILPQPLAPGAWPFGTNIQSSSSAGLRVQPKTAYKQTIIAVQHSSKQPKNVLEPIWKNDIGQTICAGDKVLVVAQGYSHQIKTRVGTFAGAKIKNGRVTSVSCYIEDKIWRGGQYVTCAVRRAYPSKRVYKLAL